jgi:hypothetical protein
LECPKAGCGKNYADNELLERHLKYKHPEIYEEMKTLKNEGEKKLLTE